MSVLSYLYVRLCYDPALEHNGPDGQVLFVQQDEAGLLAGVQGACPAVDADGLGGVVGAGPHCVRQGDAELDRLPQAAHQASDGACQRLGMAHDGGPVAVDLDLLASEGILAVGHAGGPQGVGDQDDPLLAEQLEGQADHGAVDVDAVADQLRLDTRGIEGGTDDAGCPVVDGRHSVIEMGGVGGSGLKGRLGGVVVRYRVAHGHRDAHIGGGPDELHGAGLLGSHGHQLHAALSGLLQALQHGNVGVMEKIAVLGTFLCGGEEGPLQMGAYHLRAAGVFRPVGGGVFADGRQLVLRQSHAGGADVGDALAQLKVRNALQALGGGITEILAYAAVEMHVYQTGDHVAAVGVQDLFVAAGDSEQGAVGADIPGDKALFQVKDLTAGYSHTGTPAAVSLLRAALSPTSTTSLWSCRIEAGQKGVMGPQKALYTASALSAPLAISSTRRAAMMQPMPIVSA